MISNRSKSCRGGFTLVKTDLSNCVYSGVVGNATWDNFGFQIMDEKNVIKGKDLERYFEFQNKLLHFSQNLFPYNTGDDRAIVILGASFLDYTLEHILLGFFPTDEPKVNTLLNFDQPLGTFGNRVRMIYCLGLIDKVIKDDLKLIGKIRNKFAHDLDASFENDQIKSWCEKLKWHKTSMMMEPPADATIRDLYQVGVNQIITYLHGVIGIARGERRKVKNNF